jgi:hypothetical protein
MKNAVASLVLLRSYNLLLQALLAGQSRDDILMAEETQSVKITCLSFLIQAQLLTNSLFIAKPRTSVSTVQLEFSGMSTTTFSLTTINGMILVAVWQYVFLDARVGCLNQPSRRAIL